MSIQEQFQRAVALQDSGQLQEAAHAFRALAEVASEPEEKASIMLNAAGCLGRLGRLDEALRVLDEGRRLLPPGSPLMLDFDLAETCMPIGVGRYKESLGKLNRVLEKNAESLRHPERRYLYEEYTLRKALLLVQLARHAEAAPLLEEAIGFDLPPAEKGDTCHRLAVRLYQQGEVERAKELFEKAVALGGKDCHPMRSHFSLGVIHLNAGAYARALQEFEMVLPRADEAKIPRKKVYKWLAASCRGLGLEEDARKYEVLMKTM
jgi:tetratricopeptide (TPR) repeat protein